MAGDVVTGYEARCLAAYDRECEETLRKVWAEYMDGVAELVKNVNKESTECGA